MPAPTVVEIELRQQRLLLLPQRALWWPEPATLVVADIHFGKAAAFRAKGIPVPHGTTGENLQALDALLQRYRARRLIFLGDFLHARAGRTKATLAALQEWRARHTSLDVTLVRGNHDRHAGDPPATLDIALLDEPAQIGPFAFHHHPQADSERASFVIAGHLHPVYSLVTRHERLRLPCYVLSPTQLILPAFGSFTGGLAVLPQADEKLFVATPDAVFPVPYLRRA